NWQVLQVKDGNDLDEIRAALKEAKENKNQPTLIEVKTIIGYGSPNKYASSASHGAPLGREEVTLTKEYYKWEHDEFHVAEEVYSDFEDKVAIKGRKSEETWNELIQSYKKKYPELGKDLETAMMNELPEGWDKDLPAYEPGKDKLATRAASGDMINALANSVPNLFGGSADLASSNNTMMKEFADFGKGNYDGRNIWFGVREFAMGAALNGMALHGGLKVYGG